MVGTMVDGGDARCRRARRQGAQVFVLISLVQIVTGIILGLDGSDRPVLLASVDLVVAVAVFLANRPAWARPLCYFLFVYVLVALSVAGSLHAVPSGIYGVAFVLVFVWAGTWQHPWLPLKFAPLAAAAYYAPWVLASAVHGNGDGVFSVIPVVVIVGEVVARHGARLDAAESQRDDTLRALAAAAVTDDLTGVGNHRRARQLLEDLESGDGLAVIDLDRFKSVNDRYGHAVGDRLLQRMGDFLASSTRGLGNVARIGGEEFIVVLPGAGAAAAPAVSRILRDWRRLDPLTTVSVGLCLHGEGRDVDATFALADAALYQAKALGRDRLEVAGDDGRSRAATSRA